jgi:hypothetical protein
VDGRTPEGQDHIAAAPTADAATPPWGTAGQPQQRQAGHTPAQPAFRTQDAAASSDDDGFAAAGPAYADEGPSFQERRGGTAAPAAEQRPFDDDAWAMGQRFREPRGDATGAESAADSPADPPEGQPPSADAAPPEEALTPEEVKVQALAVFVRCEAQSLSCTCRRLCRGFCRVCDTTRH